MLKQETRQRLQALVIHPDFVGSVRIVDSKFIIKGEPRLYTEVNIHGEGFNVFSLLAQLFPDMALTNVRPYETDHGEHFTFGSMSDGAIEEARVNVWANYGQKEKPSGDTESKEKLAFLNPNTNISEMVEREA